MAKTGELAMGMVGVASLRGMASNFSRPRSLISMVKSSRFFSSDMLGVCRVDSARVSWSVRGSRKRAFEHLAY